MKLFFKYLFPFITAIGFSQNSVAIDSLEQLLQKETITEKKIVLHLKLYENKPNKDKAFVNLEQAEELISDATQDSIKANVYLLKSQYYLKAHNYDEVINYVGKALEFRYAISADNLIKAYSDLGSANYYKTKYKEAIRAHQQAMRVCETNGYTERKARVLNNIGITYIKLKDWKNAEKYMYDSYELCKQFNNQRGATYTLGNLGIIYKNLGQFDDAISMYQKSLEISLALDDKVALIRNYTNIGSLYDNQKK